MREEEGGGRGREGQGETGIDPEEQERGGKR